MASPRVYLDWNATTPPLPEVLDAMRDVAGRVWGNPSSIHADGRAASAVVESARAAVALLTGGDARDVLLTSGGTEANNLAVRSAFEPGAARWLFTSRLEHPSVTRVAEALEQEGRARVRWIHVLPSGILDLADLAAALSEAAGQVALVTVQAVNHETGIVQPAAEVLALARAAGARSHVDAVQAWGKVPTEALAQADTMSLAAHKIRGPKGVGALVARAGLRLAPLLLGGAQERGLRPGTVDPALAAGLGVAARRAIAGSVRYAHVSARRDALESALLDLVPGAGAPRLAGDPRLRAPHVSTLVWPGWVGAELVAALDLEGLSVSSGAACSAGTVEPSPVIAAMLGDALAGSSVRLSLGDATTDEDVALAIAAFRRVLSRPGPAA
ncbi:MAG TPA: cysteine desulfurase family protein [Labilithrix sp.]|nr:cysteine desulfurase family protein [Labilithrix sp.]